MLRTFIIATMAITLTAPVALADRGHRGGLAFDEIDADNSGAITPAEVAAFQTARFTAADGNADGQIDAGEALDLVPTRGEHRKGDRFFSRMLNRLDTNDDELISAAEYAATDRSDRMFERLDSNEDGEITRAELESARKGHGKRGKDRR